jgi:hypothetical protein
MKKSLLIGLTAASLVVAVPATTFAGYFPADRQTYTCVNTNQCEGADHVVFDSFTNNPVVGDERPFFSGSLNGGNVQDNVVVKDGDIVTLRAYVHNNADPNKIGAVAALAHNVRIRVLVPNDSKANQNLVAFISAANANPGTINDTMSISGDRAMTLSFVPGSAKFDYAPDGKNRQLVSVGDNIVTGNGASLGDLNGCFQYSGYVTLQVKVSMPGTPVTPPTTPAAPTKLVNTGAGDVVAVAGGASILGAALYRRRLSRSLSK